MQVDAVILSGGKIKDYDTDIPKGILPVNGRPMVNIIVEAARECSDIEKIYVVAEENMAKKIVGADRIIISNGSMVENLFNALNDVDKKKKTLVISGDIPLLTSEAISDFIQICLAKNAQGYYPIVPKEVVEKKYSQTKRTYVKVREGTFTGGNLILIEPQVLLENKELIERIFSYRKSPVKLAKILGIKVIIKLIFKRLKIKEAEDLLSRLAGEKIVTVVSQYPEIGIDVDKIEDLKMVEEYMRNRV